MGKGGTWADVGVGAPHEITLLAVSAVKSN